MNKHIIYLLVILLLIIVSFFVGRSTISISEKTKFIKGETVYKTITKDSLVYKIEIPENPIYPTRIDTFYIDSIQYKTIVIDSAKVFENYIKKKTYNIQLFNDNNGKIILKPIVQYNEIQSLSYEFTPITKETIKTIDKTFTPFVQATYNSFGYIETGGGIYYHDIAIQCNYITNFNEKGFSIGINIKF